MLICRIAVFSCGDGQCIEAYKRCDFTVNCDNGADEYSCPSKCTFEDTKHLYGTCGWSNDNENDMDWDVETREVQPFDHTRGDRAGGLKNSYFENSCLSILFFLNIFSKLTGTQSQSIIENKYFQFSDSCSSIFLS